MKKTLLILYFLFISNLAFADIQINVSAPDILKEGFSGIPWGTELSGLKGFTYKATDDQGIEAYFREEKLQFHGINMEEVLYGFYKGKFCTVGMRFTGQENYEKLKKEMQIIKEGEFFEMPSNGKFYECQWSPYKPASYKGSVMLAFDKASNSGFLTIVHLIFTENKNK